MSLILFVQGIQSLRARIFVQLTDIYIPFSELECLYPKYEHDSAVPQLDWNYTVN